MAVNVGIRDLRENLRSWLERVKDGEELVVTERGKPVARISGVEERSRLDELVALGIVRQPLRKKRHDIDVSKLPTLEGEGPSLSDIVIEQRRRSRY